MAKGRVLVTGGTGFVGAHVVKLLLEHGYRVRVTVRSLTNSTKVEPLFALCPDRRQYLELIEADLLEADVWRAAIRGCDYVIHVASPLPGDVDESSSRNRAEIIRPAVEGTLNVLRAALAEGVKKVVITSSALAVYDTIKAEADNDRVHDESEWTVIDERRHKRWAYVESKVLAERAAWDFHKAQPDRPGARFALTTILPTSVVGPVLNGHSGGASQDIVATLMNRRPNYIPNFGLALCDVRDVALAHVRALEVDDLQQRHRNTRTQQHTETSTITAAGAQSTAVTSATATTSSADTSSSSTDGARILVYTRSAYLVELAQILQREFEPLGYRVNARKEPTLLAKLTVAFNSNLRRMSRMLNRLALYNNTRMRTLLGVEPTPIEKSIIDMAHTMIQRGDINITPRYAEWLARHPESNYFQQDPLAINKRINQEETAVLHQQRHHRHKHDHHQHHEHGLYSQQQADVVVTAGQHRTHLYTADQQQNVPMKTIQRVTEEEQHTTVISHNNPTTTSGFVEDDRNVAGPSSRVAQTSSPRGRGTASATMTTTVLQSERIVESPSRRAAQQMVLIQRDMIEPEVTL